MSLFGLGRSQIPFDMFDLRLNATEARRAEKLANIYHRGQELQWNGRRVLGELLDKHGGVHVAADKRAALMRIFSILMWGELAAWKVSAQLADRLVPLGAKLAASSQVHDEARHFYVMYDYLSLHGPVPNRIDRPARALLDIVLETDDLCLKLSGMQLLIETIALTIFQAVRESGVEPVLCELLRYYEKDEARHVGLGLQHLPVMLRSLPRHRAIALLLAQAQVMGWAMAELKLLEDDLRTIGVDPRRVFTLGLSKQALAFEALARETGAGPTVEGEIVNRLMTAAGEALFPDEQAQAGGVWGRLRAMQRALRGMVAPDLPPSSIDPDAPAARPAGRGARN